MESMDAKPGNMRTDCIVSEKNPYKWTCTIQGCSTHAVQRLTVMTKSQSVIILGEGTVIIKGHEETLVGSIDIFMILTV